ncbi:MAG: hydrogenase maturation protease [Acidimicrobiia bacterium]
MARLVVGLGTDDRGDDAAGLEVARRVRKAEGRPTPNPLELIDLLEEWEEVVVVDTMRSGEAPGTIRKFNLDDESLPGHPFVSSHLVGPFEALALARSLGLSQSGLVVYGIEAENVEVGEGLSAPVREAVEALVKEIDSA